MKVTSRVIRFAAAGLLLALGACGGGGDEGGGTPPPPPPPQTGIGPAGGTVLGPNGAKVEIPPGALATNTTIAIEQTSTGSPPLPGGFSTSGLMFAFTPHDTTFAVPVTITLPFDPASVPAGTTPALFKTNAQNQWEQVANAAFGATSVTAQISSFSFAQVLVLPQLADGAVARQWTFSEIRAEGMAQVQIDSRTEIVGDVSRVQEFGPADFDQELVLLDGTLLPANNSATGAIGSSADGKIFYVGTEAPIGNANNPDVRVGSVAQLVQVQTFVKRETDASLRFKVPAAFLEVHDENSFLDRECPPFFGSDPTGPCPVIDASLSFDVVAIDTGTTPETFYRLAGGVELDGFAESWEDNAWTDAVSMVPLWDKTDFELIIIDQNNTIESLVLMQIRGPRTYEVDISSVDVGDVFHLRITTTAYAHNAIAGPPSEGPNSAGAYFNMNPAQSILEFEGLGVLVTPDPLVPSPASPVTAVPCSSATPDPQAGVLEFSAASYSRLESSRTPAITITRTGGSEGAVSVTFSTSDGTATADVDYGPVNATVFFADGDASPRRLLVPMLQDILGEPDETVNLALSQPGGCAALGTQTAATLTIVDDDPTPPPPSGLDPTFSTDGKATLEGFGGDRSGMAVQPDGKVVMVGGTFADFIMARFNADGSIDDNFGDDGKVTTSMINGGQEESLGVAIQPDNKIVVVGYSGPSGRDPSVTLARYLPNGTLDDTFGVDGKAFTSVVGRAFAVALQPDGKIVIAGDVPSTEDFLIARFNANGGSDFSFANGGLTTDINVGSDLASNLVLQPDGFIVISGPHTNFGETIRDQHTGLMRVDGNGSPDGTFGVGGKLLLTGKSVGEGLALQSDGKLVLAGRVNAAAPPLLRNEFALMRLRADGTPDGTFGVGGQVITPITTLGDAALAVALQADGKIIAAGASRSQVNPNFAVARYDTAGVLDASFGNGGTLEIEFFGFTDICENVVVQSDGKIVLGGLARNNVSGYGVARVVP